MVIIKCKPTSPGRRHVIKLINKKLNKIKPYYRLLKKKKKNGGRNHHGKITTRHIGGGNKQMYRIIDFKRKMDDLPSIVKNIEYDPNRNANIALIMYLNGKKKYILAPKDLKIGEYVQSGNKSSIKNGNTLSMKYIPIGSIIHNIEMKPGKGGQLSRSAGSYARLISKDNNYVILKLKSGEIRKIESKCRATIGIVSNEKKMLISLGKAGASRWKGIRPTVRGTAMNPIDHPHGGGEGKNFGKHPVTPWGVKTKGKKTRNNKRTEKFIISHNK
ncbi:50S ribosomal protein L2 [Candidatus Annandia adelgestsuga]|uniref:Large ribosomal subunit protein uL2 n=1 Tax=Candidatus Annandia adelgestsuga TaxID=1302411 RepID=A0A3S9J7J1_9ENTR|nr:50S ribosomal protein L2 [Candidatus Annandia adelgestsuga]AZP36219.1 50S ribosomal protein L2 [Candidatus Annandia adelgestsuga]